MLWYSKIPTIYITSAFANCSPLDRVIFVCVPQYDKLHLQTLTCPESFGAPDTSPSEAHWIWSKA